MDKSTHVHASATPTGTVYATCKETVDVYIQIINYAPGLSLAGQTLAAVLDVHASRTKL